MIKISKKEFSEKIKFFALYGGVLGFSVGAFLIYLIFEVIFV